jgi:DnaJ-domain-containing protein 1
VREDPSLRRTLARGELPRLAYRLGRQGASGLLALMPAGARADVIALRRGGAVVTDGELAKKAMVARLARLASHDALAVVFEGGVAQYPPGAPHHVELADGARAHLEAQLDGSVAETVVRELAGIRLSLRAELAPLPLDEADKRMLAAMAQPRRLDQIWPLARTPRFRLLAFLYFLRGVDALEVEGVGAERSAPVRSVDPARAAALRLLGVAAGADADTVKRAYRRLARALHPDLQPDADALRRRALERRFAEVTAAYDALT